jgi:hypothetical protein
MERRGGPLAVGHGGSGGEPRLAGFGETNPRISAADDYPVPKYRANLIMTIV